MWLGNSISAGRSQNGSGWYHFVGSFCGLSVNAFLLCLSRVMISDACLTYSYVVLLGVLGCGDSCGFR